MAVYVGADESHRLIDPPPEEWCARLVDIWAKLSLPANYNIDNRAADRKWRPSIHMPRWASRILLEVVSVRAERLWDLTEEDAEREGVTPFGSVSPNQPLGDGHKGPHPHRVAFACLWDTLNFHRAPWKDNPWVWRIESKRIHTEGATK